MAYENSQGSRRKHAESRGGPKARYVLTFSVPRGRSRPPVQTMKQERLADSKVVQARYCCLPHLLGVS
jgi:hypothetical protein